MDDDNLMKDLKEVVGDQFSEVVSNIIVSNILHYITICKRHNLDTAKLYLALEQYISEAKVDGIKVPKAKGSKHSGTNVIIGNPFAYANVSYDTSDESLSQSIYKKPNVDTSVSYPYGGQKYYLTSDVIYNDHLLCVDGDHRALLAWDPVNEVEIKLDMYYRAWLTDRGYKISPFV